MNVKPAKVIRAQRFEVVDDEGRVRARIGPRTGAPWRSKGERLVAFELFDVDGKAVASLTADDNGHTVELLVGAAYDSGHVRIRRLGDRGLYGARAEISAWAAHHSRWSACAVAGAFSKTYEGGPDFRGGDMVISDRASLRRAVDVATREIVHLRKKATEARNGGDRSRYRSFLYEATQLQRRIDRATTAFEKLEADRMAASMAGKNLPR